MVAGMTDPSVVSVSTLNATPKTTVFEDTWQASGVKVRWAEEQFGDARIARIRAVEGGAAGAAQGNALLATLRHMRSYMEANPTVDRILVNRKALDGSPTLQALFEDVPKWKGTKDYYVMWKADLDTFLTSSTPE